MRRVIDQTLALLAASARSRHLRVRAGFINENKSAWIKRRLRPFPFFARLRHIFAMLLAGVQRFFIAEFVALKETRNRAVRGFELKLIQKAGFDLGQRKVALARNQSQKPIRMSVQWRWPQFLARLFGKAARVLEASEPFNRRRFRNHQLPCRSPPRHATLNQRNHTLTQIEGMASRHAAPPNQCEAQNRSFLSLRESRLTKIESKQMGNALL